MDWCGVDQSGDAGQDSNESERRGGHVEAAGAVAQQATPVAEPPEAALHHPAAFEHDKTLLGRIARDHAAAHAMKIAPALAALGAESAVQHRLAQARPSLLARCQACLPGVRASRQSRSGTLAGTTATDHRNGPPQRTTATARQTPSASTKATRLRPRTFLAAS